MTDYNFEQYKILTTYFNDEVTRFWSRFNILMGIQMGGFIGILASLKTLFLNVGLFRLALIFMTFYSVATTIIALRGHIMHESMIKMILMMERESDGKLKILSLARKVSKVPVGLNQIIGICISTGFSIAWIAFLIHSESIDYAFIFLK